MSTTPSSLDTIFKAYDIRGVYPDQLDESIAASGRQRVRRVHRRAAWSWSVATPAPRRSRSIAAFFARRHRGGRRRRRPRPGLHRPRLLRLGAPRRARRDVHRQPQPGPVQRHQAVPGRRGAGRGGDRPQPTSAPLVADGHARRQRAAAAGSSASDLLPDVRHPRPVVRRRRHAHRAADRRRHRQRARRPGRPRRVRRPARSSVELLYGELDGTFPNHPADPIQPENLVDLQRARPRPRRRRRPRLRRGRRPGVPRRRPGRAALGVAHHHDRRRVELRGCRSTRTAAPTGPIVTT